jgi:DNA-binding MarR family transcriptional regulator
MRLEEAIKQEHFKSEHQKAMLNILVTSNCIDADFAKILKPFEISSQQYNVLRILKGQGDKAISVSNIMSRMIDKMSNVSRLLEKLRKKELVERVVCASDRRQVDVRITQEGLELLVKIEKVMVSFDDGLSKITNKEAERLNKILEKIRS